MSTAWSPVSEHSPLGSNRGGLSIDARSREVRLDQRVIELTRTEFDLLLTLSQHPRQVFTARQLFQTVWSSDWFDADHVIETHISRLRRKLGESGSRPRYIRTVRGVGYRFEPAPPDRQTAPTDHHEPFGHCVVLSPDYTVAHIDPYLAALAGVDGPTCRGQQFAQVMEQLASSVHLQYLSYPIHDHTGSLVGIHMDVLVRGDPDRGWRDREDAGTM